MPAGPFSFALGAASRKENIAIQDVGLVVHGLLNRISGSPNLDADFNVNEACMDVLAALISDKSFVQELSVEEAVRYSHYNTIGSTTAWKPGASWAPIKGVRFRYTLSQSVRAPNLNELYTPGSLISALFVNPCQLGLQATTPNRAAHCSALGLPEDLALAQADSDGFVATGGNPNLAEETSDSYTIGVLIRPGGFESFQMSIDY